MFSCKQGQLQENALAELLFCNNYKDYYKRKNPKELYWNNFGQDGTGHLTGMLTRSRSNGHESLVTPVSDTWFLSIRVSCLYLEVVGRSGAPGHDCLDLAVATQETSWNAPKQLVRTWDMSGTPHSECQEDWTFSNNGLSLCKFDSNVCLRKCKLKSEVWDMTEHELGNMFDWGGNRLVRRIAPRKRKRRWRRRKEEEKEW